MCSVIPYNNTNYTIVRTLSHRAGILIRFKSIRINSHPLRWNRFTSTELTQRISSNFHRMYKISCIKFQRFLTDNSELYSRIVIFCDQRPVKQLDFQYNMKRQRYWESKTMWLPLSLLIPHIIETNSWTYAYIIILKASTKVIRTVSIHNNNVYIWLKWDQIESWPKWIESHRIVSLEINYT